MQLASRFFVQTNNDVIPLTYCWYTIFLMHLLLSHCNNLLIKEYPQFLGVVRKQNLNRYYLQHKVNLLLL